jgi:hypothetical protein
MDMTSPRYSYGGASYAATPYPDTPIYDMLVAERGTPQIAPIRVPPAYDPAAQAGSNLPALPPALPALPAAPSYASPQGYGYPGPAGAPQQGPGMGQPGAQPAPLQQAMPYAPQQQPQRGYQDPRQFPQQQPQPPQQGYQQQPQMRPVAAPRPVPPQQAAPGGYDNGGYGQQQYQGRGY